MDSRLRIVFAGTPDFAAESLKALLQSQHEVIAVYTQPDRPAGRGRELRASPVKELAAARKIPVYQPLSLRDPVAQAELYELKPDLMVVAAYGLILPKDVLGIPRYGCLNVHASLLPRWRGAAPIQRAILAGDRETGITIMQMDVGLDTGAMLYKVPCPISENDTGESLHDRLALLGGDALIAALELLEEGELTPEPQDERQATYAAKLHKDEARVDWTRPAAEVARAIRAYNAWPVAFAELAGQTIRIWLARALNDTTTAPPGMIIAADKHGIAVAAGAGTVVQLEQLQLPGGRALPVADLLNARRDLFTAGARFSL